MNSILVHLKNCFPTAVIIATQLAIDVMVEGVHYLGLRVADGVFIDKSEELGLPGRFSLAPIPKEARVHKLKKDGTIGLDEDHKSRMKARAAFMDQDGIRVLSCAELEAKGFRFEKSKTSAGEVYGACTHIHNQVERTERPQYEA